MEVLTVGQIIKKFRTEKKLKLKDLAGNFISVSKLSFIENNKTHPTYKELQHIAKVIGVPVKELSLTVKEQIYRKYKDIVSEDGSIKQFLKLIELAEKRGESELAFDLLKEYTIKLIMDNDQEEIINILPELFRNVLANYSQQKMSEYVFSLSSYLTNCNENISSYKFLKQLVDEASSNPESIENRDLFDITYLRCLLSQGKVKEAKKVAEEIYSRLEKIEKSEVRSEALFLIKGYTLLTQDEGNFRIDKDEVIEGLNHYPFRASQNYLFLADLAASKGSIKEAMRFLNRAEAVSQKSSTLRYLNLIEDIISKFLKLPNFVESEKLVESYMNKALSYGMVHHIEKCYWYMAIISFKRGDMDTAEMFLNVSLDILKKGNDVKALKSRYKDLSIFYYSNKDYKNSIKYLALSH